MKVLVSIYDFVSNIYSSPVLELNNDVAIRNFKLGIGQNSMVQACPADFELRLLGEFDEETGIITPDADHPTLIKAVDVLRSDGSK